MSIYAFSNAWARFFLRCSNVSLELFFFFFIFFHDVIETLQVCPELFDPFCDLLSLPGLPVSPSDYLFCVAGMFATYSPTAGYSTDSVVHFSSTGTNIREVHSK